MHLLNIRNWKVLLPKLKNTAEVMNGLQGGKEEAVGITSRRKEKSPLLMSQRFMSLGTRHAHTAHTLVVVCQPVMSGYYPPIQN